MKGKRPPPPRGWLKNQSRADIAALCHQDIVGTAGSTRIHDFHSDSRACQWLKQAGARKTQFAACTQQDDFHVQSDEEGDLVVPQGTDIGHIPVLDELTGQHDEAVLVASRIDQYIPFPIAGEGVLLVYPGKMEFQL